MRKHALVAAMAATGLALPSAAARAQDAPPPASSFEKVTLDLRQVRSALDDLLPLLRPGHGLILRSTIAPGTTEFVAGYLEKRRGLRAGEDVFVAHAPERIAAGKFLREITSLPCMTEERTSTVLLLDADTNLDIDRLFLAIIS